jgi:hypothetical protein
MYLIDYRLPAQDINLLNTCCNRSHITKLYFWDHIIIRGADIIATTHTIPFSFIGSTYPILELHFQSAIAFSVMAYGRCIHIGVGDSKVEFPNIMLAISDLNLVTMKILC